MHLVTLERNFAGNRKKVSFPFLFSFHLQSTKKYLGRYDLFYLKYIFWEIIYNHFVVTILHVSILWKFLSYVIVQVLELVEMLGYESYSSHYPWWKLRWRRSGNRRPLSIWHSVIQQFLKGTNKLVFYVSIFFGFQPLLSKSLIMGIK